MPLIQELLYLYTNLSGLGQGILQKLKRVDEALSNPSARGKLLNETCTCV